MGPKDRNTVPMPRSPCPGNLAHGSIRDTIIPMSHWTKLLADLRAGQHNLAFDDLCGLVKHLGYVQRRQNGSHLIFAHPGRPDCRG